MANFFELEKNTDTNSTTSDFLQLKTSSTPQLVETDSSLQHPQSDSSNTNNADTVASFSSSIIPQLGNKEGGDNNISFDGGGNFFKNPEIKMKMKKADGIPIMTDFMKEVVGPFANKWREFAVEIGLKENTLDSIQQKNSTRDSNDTHCFVEVFTEWEKDKESQYKPFTWQTIIDVLKCKLNEYETADSIESRFLNHLGTSHVHLKGRESGYSSLPSSINQPNHSSGMSPPSSISQPGRSSSISPPPRSPDTLSSTYREGSNIHARSNRIIKGNVLPSPDNPFNDRSISTTHSSSSGHSELLFGNPRVPIIQPPPLLGTSLPLGTPSNDSSSTRIVPPDIQFDNNSGSVPLYDPIQHDNLYTSINTSSNSSSNSSSTQIPRGGIIQSPLSLTPHFMNTNFGNELNQGFHSQINNYDRVIWHSPSPHNYSPDLNQQSSHNHSQLSRRSEFPQGSQFTQESQLLQGSQFPHGSQFTQGSQLLQGSQFPHGSQFTQGSHFSQGSQFPHGSQFPSGPHFSQGSLLPQQTQFPQQGPSPHGLINSTVPPFLGSQLPQVSPQVSPEITLLSQSGIHNSSIASFSQTPQFSHNNSPPFLFGGQYSQNAPPYSQSAPPYSQGTGLPYHSQGLVVPQEVVSLTTQYQQPLLPIDSVITTTTSNGYHDDSSKQYLADSHEEQSSSYHSAITTLKKHEEVSFNELLQKYMKDMENRQDEKYHKPIKTKSIKLVARRLNKENNGERESLTQKEIDKAYQRISALEIRIQDLTMQNSIEIPEDHEVTYMQKDKLQQEFLRMREMKRQAEKQTMEAKQTTQRLVAENSRLKEELAIVKNDREMIVNQLKKDNRSNREREKHEKELEIFTGIELKDRIEKKYKKMTESVGISRKEHLLINVADMPPMSVTPKLFSKILNTEKGTLSLGHVAIAGLPACGKSTILKTLLQHENPGKPLKGRGEETCLEVHEILITQNPLTEETKWYSAPGLESAIHLFSSIVVQHCLRNKCRPMFPSLDNLEKEVKLIPLFQDKEIQQHFLKVYKAIKVLIEEKARMNCLSELALFQPRFINIWDIGVNRALYEFLASAASQCERLVMVLFIDLEQDIPELNEPPDMDKKKSYADRGDDKLVMKVHSRLRYLLVLAGIKRLFSCDSATINAPEAILIGLHKKEYALLNGGKKLQQSIELLQRAILVEANKMKIRNVIAPKIPTFCTNASNEREELNKLKLIIEDLVQSQTMCNTVFEANSMFLRSLLYGKDQPLFVSRRTFSELASKCNIFFEDQISDFLTDCRNTGSVMFYPKSTNKFLYENITLDIIKPLKLLDRLYYLPTYLQSGSINPIDRQDLEQYKYGMVSKTLLYQLFNGEETDLFVQYLLSSLVCADVSLSGSHDTYFFPSLRTSVDKTPPNSHSLFIKHSSDFLQHSACLTLYVKFLNEFFKVPSEAVISHTSKCNNVMFKIYKTIGSSKHTDVLVISHLEQSLVEIRIPDLETKIDLDLCSKFVRLSHMVFQHLSDHLQFLHFDLCVKCPENKDHFTKFFLRYHRNEVYCEVCTKSVTIKDNRSCWLS